MTFKAIQDELPGYMSEMLKFNHNNIYQLRSNDCKLYLGKPNTDFMKNLFHVGGLVHGMICQAMLSNVNGCNKLSTRSFKTLINNHFNALG